MSICDIGIPGKGIWPAGRDEEVMFPVASMRNKFFSFLILIVSDLTGVLLCFVLAYSIRDYILPALFSEFKSVWLHPFSNFLDYYYMAFLWIAIFAYERLYTKRFSFWDEIRILWKSSTISFVIITVIIFMSRKQIYYSRTVVVLSWLLSLCVIPGLRIAVKILLTRLGVWKKKLIILGTNETGYLVLKNLKKNPSMGYEIVGFLGDDPEQIGEKCHGENVIGSIADLEDIINRYNSKDVVISMPDLSREKLASLLQLCEKFSESTWIIPQTGDLITTGIDIEKIGQVMALSIKKNLEKPWNILIKNVFDKLMTLILIIFCTPVLIVIPIAIKLDSGGPILFKQQRVGEKKSLFTLFKFRSMYVDGNSRLQQYLSDSPIAQEEWKKYRKLKSYDPRVTRVGRIIRKYSLDEIPQLFNIVLGKMSLVGPRPYLIEELKGKAAFTGRIAKVKPGITGLWQVSGRSEVFFEERIGLDDYYIRNWTLWLDIVILLRSLKALFSGEGAY